MDLAMTGKVAVVFGASRGLGRAVAVKLAEEGCRVVALARSVERLKPAECGITPIACDVTDKASIQRMIGDVRATLGAPDILIYNNGGPADSVFDEATDQEFLDG